MYYSIGDSRMRYVIDRHRTGDYGETAQEDNIFCDGCQGKIRSGDNYYVVRDNVFCEFCEDYADDVILGLVRNDFLYQL